MLEEWNNIPQTCINNLIVYIFWIIIIWSLFWLVSTNYLGAPCKTHSKTISISEEDNLVTRIIRSDLSVESGWQALRQIGTTKTWKIQLPTHFPVLLHFSYIIYFLVFVVYNFIFGHHWKCQRKIDNTEIDFCPRVESLSNVATNLKDISKCIMFGIDKGLFLFLIERSITMFLWELFHLLCNRYFIHEHPQLTLT